MGIWLYITDPEDTDREYLCRNMTYNLAGMADAAGIYDEIYGLGTRNAKDIIRQIGLGLARLETDPEYYKNFNASNGWGLYEHFVPFVRNIYNTIQSHPDSILHVNG